MFLRIVLAYFILIAFESGFAQTADLDSMYHQLKLAKQDTSQINILNGLSKMYIFSFDDADHLEKGYHFADSAMKLSVIINYIPGLAEAEMNLGYFYYRQFIFSSAKQHFTSALRLFGLLNNKKHQASISALIGYIYRREQNYASAHRYQDTALQLRREIGDSVLVADSYNLKAELFETEENYVAALATALYASKLFDAAEQNDKSAEVDLLIAYIHYRLGKFEDATSIYQRYMKKRGKDASMFDTAYVMQGMGNIYYGQGKYEKALENHKKALAYFTTLKEKSFYGWAHYSMGKAYERIAMLETNSQSKNAFLLLALKNNVTALGYYKEQNDKVAISEANTNIGRVYFELRDLRRSRQYFNESLALSISVGHKSQIRDNYMGLSRIDSAEKKYESAYKNYRYFTLYKDSLVNEENIRQYEAVLSENELQKQANNITQLSTQNKLQTALAQKENQRKNFALAGIAVIALVGTYGFYRFRKKKKLQNEQNLLAERLRISRELHDEVGATLSGVSMYSHLTKTQLQSQDLAGVESSLSIMQDSSAQMVNKLNDIVWLINPDKSSLPDLMQKLEEYARKMAAAKNMEVKTDFAENIHQYQLDMEQRRNIYLFCKEAINNAAKYSEGTLLELSIKEEGKLLEFVIRDNGKGFDPETARKGNGLNSMQQRAEEMNGIYQLTTSVAKGTKIICVIKPMIQV